MPNPQNPLQKQFSIVLKPQKRTDLSQPNETSHRYLLIEYSFREANARSSLFESLTTNSVDPIMGGLMYDFDRSALFAISELSKLNIFSQTASSPKD